MKKIIISTILFIMTTMVTMNSIADNVGILKVCDPDSPHTCE